MLRAGATQAPEPCRVEYGAASLQKVNRASPGACFDIGQRPRNLERAEREQVEQVNTNRRTASSSFIGMSLLEAEVGIEQIYREIELNLPDFAGCSSLFGHC